jgi:hypothetical protein
MFMISVFLFDMGVVFYYFHLFWNIYYLVANII